MKISESTLEVLQNFSSINNGITVQTGNEIKTISPMKNIFGRATLSDNFQCRSLSRRLVTTNVRVLCWDNCLVV